MVRNDLATDIEERLLQADLSAEAWPRAGNGAGDPAVRRLLAGLYALAGRDRRLAAVVDADLLACHSGADAAAWFERLSGGGTSLDLVAAAAVLSWSGDPSDSYACLRKARELALSEHRPHLAAGAAERLAHHAILCGDVEIATEAIDGALSLSAMHGLAGWWFVAAAPAAGLALDRDDLDRSGELLEESRRGVNSAERLARFAGAGVRHAMQLGDEDALAFWASPAMLRTALESVSSPSAIGAATACALAVAGQWPLSGPVATALRRGLAMVEHPAAAIEFLSLAARCGDADEARFAVDAMRAMFAPHRRYVEAHYLLARAYLLLREGDRSTAIDSAGDAARAFDAIGLRHWTNEAMLLLVRHEELPEAQQRRRPTAASLTRREQQVAHLIRRGASNREVARTLQISEHTVERHVSSILSRLGLRSRWQIVDAPSSHAAAEIKVP